MRAAAVGQSGADNGGPPMASENADQIADRIRQHRQAAQLLTGRPASRKNLKPCCLRGAFRGAPLLLQTTERFVRNADSSVYNGNAHVIFDAFHANGNTALRCVSDRIGGQILYDPFKQGRIAIHNDIRF